MSKMHWKQQAKQAATEAPREMLVVETALKEVEIIKFYQNLIRNHKISSEFIFQFFFSKNIDFE